MSILSVCFTVRKVGRVLLDSLQLRNSLLKLYNSVCFTVRKVGRVLLDSLQLKPLSHQGSVLTVIPRRPKEMQNAEVRQYERMQHRSNAVASPLDAVGSHRTPSDGAHFEHTQNKHRHSAFAGPPNRAQRGHREVTKAAQ